MEVPILRFLLELVSSLLIGFLAGRRHETLSTRLAFLPDKALPISDWLRPRGDTAGLEPGPAADRGAGQWFPTVARGAEQRGWESGHPRAHRRFSGSGDPMVCVGGRCAVVAFPLRDRAGSDGDGHAPGQHSSSGHRAGGTSCAATQATGGKLLLYPLLLLFLASLLQFKPLMVQAIALQRAAPTAISPLLIAESVGADQERAVGLVFWSTLLALMTAPAWGVLLRSQF